MTFFKQQAVALEISFTSTFKREIGRQFFINLLSLSCFSITFIIACFCEIFNSPTKKDCRVEAKNGSLRESEHFT